jgi:hypothetical protein
MTAAGYPVDFTTIARWKRQDWQSNSNEDHPLDAARAKLEAIAPLATGDPAPTEANDPSGAMYRRWGESFSFYRCRALLRICAQRRG